MIFNTAHSQIEKSPAEAGLLSPHQTTLLYSIPNRLLHLTVLHAVGEVNH
jgi:hypothetical protein